MNEAKIAALASKFLDRCPLEGHEAEQLVLVKVWLREKMKPLPTPAPQVAEPPGK